MRVAADDNTEIWWERQGDGPTVVFVPGRGDSTDLFPEGLAVRLRDAGLGTLRFDPRDTGLSGDGGDSYTMATMADDLVVVLDAAGVGAAHVVGVSMAGLIMVELASTRPDRVSSLTFVSAMSPDPDAGMGEDFFVGLDGDPYDNMVRAMGEVTDADRAWVVAELEAAALRAPARPEAASRHQEAAFRLGWPTLDDLARIAAPTVVFHGRLDRLLPIPHAEALATRIDGASLLLRDTMGHLPRPADWDVIADEVVRLVQRAG